MDNVLVMLSDARANGYLPGRALAVRVPRRLVPRFYDCATCQASFEPKGRWIGGNGIECRSCWVERCERDESARRVLAALRDDS